MGRHSEESNIASDRQPSGKKDGMANHPGMPRFEEFPRTGNFCAKTRKVLGKLGQAGHLFHFTHLDSNCWHAKKKSSISNSRKSKHEKREKCR